MITHKSLLAFLTFTTGCKGAVVQSGQNVLKQPLITGMLNVFAETLVAKWWTGNE